MLTEKGAIALEGGAWGAERIPCQVAAVTKWRGWRGTRQQLAQQQISRNRARNDQLLLQAKGGCNGGRRDAPLAKSRNPACGVDVNHLRATYFFEPTKETKRSASYTLLPANFQGCGCKRGSALWVVLRDGWGGDGVSCIAHS